MDATQPDYAAWRRVRKGMPEKAVRDLLGEPIESSGSEHGKVLIYGTIDAACDREPARYHFLVVTDASQTVHWVEDPFMGRLSEDGRPLAPQIVSPGEAQLFTHYPRIYDARWTPVSGAYPLTYEIETQLECRGEWAPLGEANPVDALRVTLSHPGAQGGRLRVRACNTHGAGPWSPWRAYAFQI